jgi:cytochrome c oxidase subunit 2
MAGAPSELTPAPIPGTHTSSGWRTALARPISTRRGFVAAASFGVVSLDGSWAPRGDGDHDADAAATPSAGGHAGHGGGAVGPTVEELRSPTEAFVARHGLPDGSVRPVPLVVAADAHAGHGNVAAGEGRPAAVDVYLMAYRWGYEPATLRLGVGVPYRFRMMAVDTSHGASIQLGSASRIIRLRRGALVEQELTFTRPGDHLVYCTVYCGIAHDRMAGRILVT